MNNIEQTKEPLVDFDTAKLASEKGFDWDVVECYLSDGSSTPWLTRNIAMIGKYDVSADELDSLCEGLSDLDAQQMTLLHQLKVVCNAPTQVLLQRWLRQVHNLIISVDIDGTGNYYISYYKNQEDNSLYGVYPTWEEALEVGLFDALNKI